MRELAKLVGELPGPGAELAELVEFAEPVELVELVEVLTLGLIEKPRSPPIRL